MNRWRGAARSGSQSGSYVRSSAAHVNPRKLCARSSVDQTRGRKLCARSSARRVNSRKLCARSSAESVKAWKLCARSSAELHGAARSRVAPGRAAEEKKNAP